MSTSTVIFFPFLFLIAFKTKLFKSELAMWLSLIKFGVSARQLTYRGYGYSLPLIDKDSEDARLKNRRTEVKVIGSYE